MSGIQKSIKVLAICFAVFIITSIASSALFLLSFIYDFSRPASKAENFNEVYENINNIDIELSASKLVIKEGEKFKIEAESITNKFSAKSNNGTLKIEESRKWHFNNDNSANITLYIPKDYLLNSLSIDNGAGTLEINNISVQDFEIKQGAGVVKINNSDFNKTNIDGGVGEIKISNSKLNDLDLQAGIGSININSVITGNSNIESGIGKIDLLLDDKSNYQIHVTKGIGNISIDNKNQANDTIYGTGNNKLKVDGGIGEIIIRFNH